MQARYRFSIEGSPAPAGIDPRDADDVLSLVRFPRTRGDRPDALASSLGKDLVPPHPRG